MTCAGDKTALCGAGNRLNSYYSSDSSKVHADPTIKTVVGNWTYYNCVVDSPRALTKVTTNSTAMSAEYCTQLADAGGYTWAGMEYGRECWMGKSLASGTANATSVSECGKTCTGDAMEICGGSSRLTLYQKVVGTS